MPHAFNDQETLSGIASPEGIAPATQPNALLMIDQHRATVVAGVVATWGDILERAEPGVSKEQLRAALTALRADHLLSASLSGSLAGLRAVLVAGNAGRTADNTLLHTKALGNPATDLVYTPVTPCRVVDTRVAGGPFSVASQTRNYLVHNPAGNFSAQGGNGDECEHREHARQARCQRQFLRRDHQRRRGPESVGDQCREHRRGDQPGRQPRAAQLWQSKRFCRARRRQFRHDRRGNNTGIGNNALSASTSGGQNAASGALALSANTSGGQNTASGYAALLGNTLGGSNTANGVNALQTNAIGNFNTASGGAALTLPVTRQSSRPTGRPA